MAFTTVLPDIMIIADEVDSQLKQAIDSFLTADREKARVRPWPEMQRATFVPISHNGIRGIASRLKLENGGPWGKALPRRRSSANSRQLQSAAVLTVRRFRKSNRRHGRHTFTGGRFAPHCVALDGAPSSLRPSVSLLLPDFAGVIAQSPKIQLAVLQLERAHQPRQSAAPGIYESGDELRALLSSPHLGTPARPLPSVPVRSHSRRPGWRLSCVPGVNLGAPAQSIPGAADTALRPR